MLRRKPGPDYAKRHKAITSVRPILGKLKFLGMGKVGRVFMAVANIAGSKPKRVAIKKFHKALSEEEAQEYQRTIEFLHKKGVINFHAGMHKLTADEARQLSSAGEFFETGEWIQITELFGGTFKGSKLHDRDAISVQLEKKGISLSGAQAQFYYCSYATKKKAIELQVVLANNDLPCISDAIIPSKDGRSLVIDFDNILPTKRNPFFQNLKERNVAEIVVNIEGIGSNFKQRSDLLAAAIRKANPELREALQRAKKAIFPRWKTLPSMSKPKGSSEI